MGHVRTPYNWKKYVYHRGCSFSIQSILQNGLILGGHGKRQRTADGLLHTALTLLVEIPMNKNLVMVALFFRKCTTSHWKRKQDAVSYCSFGRRSHTQSLYTVQYQVITSTELFFKRISNIVRKSLESTTCAKSHTQKQLAIAAAAAAAIDSGGRDLHMETCARQNGDKGCQRQHKMIKLAQGDLCKILSMSRCYLTR